MASFLLHDAKSPEQDMFVINPSIVPVEDEADIYARQFTEECHEEGRTTEELIPLADALISLAADSNH